MVVDLKSMKLVENIVTNMITWCELHLRLQKNKKIKLLSEERDNWRKVLFMILLKVKFLAHHNIAFHGSNRTNSNVS